MAPHPHFQWPPRMPGLGRLLAEYVDSGESLSIVGREGVIRDLEDEFSRLLGRRYAILTSSGTMALYSAFFGLDLRPEDEVISTVYSFHATATPLLHLGVHVIFCDVEPDTGNIDPLELERLVTAKTKAVVTNHMWGHPVDIDRVRAICDRNGLAWVEDCSHAHFSEYKGRYVGTNGTVSIMSLQGDKLLTGGEGGVLLTDSTRVYERATLLGHSLKRSEKCVKDPKWRDIIHTGFGLKFRIHPLAAVMVMYLLKNYLFDWIDARERTLDRFSTALCSQGIIMPMARRHYVTSMGAHYGFKPRLDFQAHGVTRERLVQALQAEGLEVTVPASLPFHRLGLFDNRRFQLAGFTKARNDCRIFPGADTYYDSILSFPTFTFESEWPIVDDYVSAVQEVLGRSEEIP